MWFEFVRKCLLQNSAYTSHSSPPGFPLCLHTAPTSGAHIRKCSHTKLVISGPMWKEDRPTACLPGCLLLRDLIKSWEIHIKVLFLFLELCSHMGNRKMSVPGNMWKIRRQGRDLWRRKISLWFPKRKCRSHIYKHLVKKVLGQGFVCISGDNKGSPRKSAWIRPISGLPQHNGNSWWKQTGKCSCPENQGSLGSIPKKMCWEIRAR